jgi:hypothetical protein
MVEVSVLVCFLHEDIQREKKIQMISLDQMNWLSREDNKYDRRKLILIYGKPFDQMWLWSVTLERSVYQICMLIRIKSVPFTLCNTNRRVTRNTLCGLAIDITGNFKTDFDRCGIINQACFFLPHIVVYICINHNWSYYLLCSLRNERRFDNFNFRCLLQKILSLNW